MAARAACARGMLHGGALQWHSMLTILAITFPFFALVLCGYLAVRRTLLPLAAIGGLNGFVLYFALTCMLLVACLPSASNVSLLSERFGANTARIARIILVSTALSFLTFSAAVSWLA